MRLVQRRFHISQQPPSLLPPLPLTHSPLHSPAPCFADLSVLAQWQYTTAHSLHNERGRERTKQGSHMKGDNDPSSSSRLP